MSGAGHKPNPDARVESAFAVGTAPLFLLRSPPGISLFRCCRTRTSDELRQRLPADLAVGGAGDLADEHDRARALISREVLGGMSEKRGLIGHAVRLYYHECRDHRDAV